MKAVPASLVRFQEELDQAVRRDRAFASSRRRRRVGTRIAVTVLAFGAVALGSLSIFSNDAPLLVHSASAKSIIRLAVSSLTASPGSILHVDITGVQKNGDGSSTTWRDESWQQESAPYDRRQIETRPGQGTTESAIDDGQGQVYDPSTNTIYVDASTPSPGPKFKIEPGSTAGTYRLQLPALPSNVAGPSTLTISAAQAKALRDGTDIVGWTFFKHNGALSASASIVPASSRPATPSEPNPNPDSPAFASEILALLRSGNARVVGPATVDGQSTIEIDSSDGRTTYYVDAKSYAPVQLNTQGTDGGTSLQFHIYETLTGAAARNSLLSLATQHPTATIDRSAANYQAAQARLFPNG
jgi:hypothetical protein